MMGKVNFSIVGCGRIGLRHAKHITNQAQLIAVCDIDVAALNRISEKYPNIKLYSNFDSFLSEDIESQIVNICTPNGLHAEQTIQVLKSGRHVVCEKPMALSVEDTNKMIEAAEKNNRLLFVVKQNRFNQPVQKVKELLDAGKLGEIYSMQVNCFWNRNERYFKESPWKGSKELDGGILFTQFSHFIDLIYWFLGDIEDVQAMKYNYSHQNYIDFDDTVVALLKLKSGAMVTLHCTINSYGKNMEGSITLFGEKGTVKVGGQYLNVLEYQNIEDYTIKELKEHRPPNDYGYYQGSMSNHDKVIENVIDVVKNNGKMASSGYDGKKTIEIIEKIYNSLNP